MLVTHDLPWAKFMLHNSNEQISRNRFRLIARHQISTWSRRWTVNLVTAGGARRAVFFINKLFFNLKFPKTNISRNRILKCSKNIPKFGKWKFEKKNLGAHMIFSSFVDCNLYQNHTANLAFATRSSQKFKKYTKNQNFTFSKVVVDRCLRLQLPRG